MNVNKNRAFLAISLSIMGISTVASSVDVPHTFSSGTAALASEVNSNFNAVETAVNDNDARIAQLESENAALSAANAALLAAVKDYDLDGDTYTIGDGDCNDNDYDINPGVNDDPSDGIDNDCNGVTDDGSQVYAVGDTGPAGGIVFSISNGGINGLEAAPVDQDDGIGAEWGCSGTNIAGAAGLAIGTGEQNTVDMLAAGCAPGIPGTDLAADLVDAYSLNGFDDWFLPSRGSLDVLYAQKDVVGGFAADVYWSSSETNNLTAWGLDFDDAGIHLSGNKINPWKVRAIRAF